MILLEKCSFHWLVWPFFLVRIVWGALRILMFAGLKRCDDCRIAHRYHRKQCMFFSPGLFQSNVAPLLLALKKTSLRQVGHNPIIWNLEHGPKNQMVLVLFQTSSKKDKLKRDTHVQTTTQKMLQEAKSSPWESDHLLCLGFPFPFFLAAGSSASGRSAAGRLPGPDLGLAAGTFGITCLRKHQLDLVEMRNALGLTSVCTSTSLKLWGSKPPNFLASDFLRCRSPTGKNPASFCPPIRYCQCTLPKGHVIFSNVDVQWIEGLTFWLQHHSMPGGPFHSSENSSGSLEVLMVTMGFTHLVGSYMFLSMFLPYNFC